MEGPVLMGFDYITDYAPARILALGVARLLFGLLIGFMGALTIWATSVGEMKPSKPGDMPSAGMYIVGAALAFTGFCFASGAVGRIISAFARNCYLSAGPGGIKFRIPVQGWFGRFRMADYNLAWSEINRLAHFTNRVNYVPLSRELRIELKNGKMISIPRHYFVMSPREIEDQLARYSPVVGR